jgi:hypothetical protein
VELHEWLLANFNGYTLAHGKITGCWRDAGQPEMAGKYLEYRVACSDEAAIPRLEQRLADLAHELGEQCIFWEQGEKAWLIYPSLPSLE